MKGPLAVDCENGSGLRVPAITGSRHPAEEVVLETGCGSVRVALQGAHVLSYVAGAARRETLWTGPYSVAPGKDCWGGIPLCWPWFMLGAGPDPLTPFHGPARLLPWICESQGTLADGSAAAGLVLPGPISSHDGRVFPLEARLDIRLAESLRLQLTTWNRGRDTVRLEHCFHSYFLVGDVTRASLRGLPAPTAAERAGGIFRQAGDDAAMIPGAASHTYPKFPETLRLVDPVLRRTILIRSLQASHLVVWNSGPPREHNGRPTGEAEWRTQLALEALRGGEHAVALKRGQSAMLDLEIQVVDAS